MSTIAEPAIAAPHAFRNEPVSDFSKSANREAMERALREVRAQLGREYDLLIAGRREKTPDKLKSLNPSRPSEVVGVHSKATAELAKEAVESAHAYFPQWAAVSAETRARILLRAAALFRERKFEFDAWLVSRPARPGPKPTPMFPKRSISANTTRARCCVCASRIRWCSCRASRTNCSTCRWAWA